MGFLILAPISQFLFSHDISILLVGWVESGPQTCLYLEWESSWRTGRTGFSTSGVEVIVIMLSFLGRGPLAIELTLALFADGTKMHLTKFDLIYKSFKLFFSM